MHNAITAPVDSATPGDKEPAPRPPQPGGDLQARIYEARI
jgi:hypothetical protein